MINLNQGVSTPIALTIIIALSVVLVGGVFAYQYYYLPGKETKIPEIKALETPKDETVSGWTCGDTLAYGGDNYDTVLIGSQCWMAENLNVTDGNEDQACTFTRYCHSDNPTNCDTYGGLYQWAGIMCGESSSNSEPSGVQGICPNDWHIPSHYEWVTLERQICSNIGNSGCDTTFPKELIAIVSYLGQEEAITAEGEGSAMAGNEPLWLNGNLDNSGAGNNDFATSGLDVLPAGYRSTDGSYYSLGYDTYFWSSLESDGNAWRRTLYYSRTDVFRRIGNKLFGSSVRCLKD